MPDAALESTPPEFSDKIPVTRDDGILGHVAAARRRAGQTIPRWIWGLLLLACIGLWLGGLAAFLVLIGFLVLGLGLESPLRAHRSRRWPTTLGVIVERAIRESRTMTDGEGDHSIATYTPIARYTYRVDGVEYAGVSWQDGATGYRDLDRARQRIRDDWPVGKALTVRYDPADPFSHTTLPPDVGAAVRRSAVLLAIGVGLVAAGGVLGVI